MTKSVADVASLQINEIDRLLATYADLFLRVTQRAPDHIEMGAVWMLVRWFYAGIENIFRVVAKRIDHKVVAHDDLLAQMRQETELRTNVISDATALQLLPYLKFHDDFEHTYLHHLEWDDMKDGVLQLHDVWAQAKSELLAFVETLNEE